MPIKIKIFLTIYVILVAIAVILFENFFGDRSLIFIITALAPLMILGILLKELFLLKLIRLFFKLNLDIIFLVCLVSSHAIRETLSRIFNALGERSFRFPIGVPTIYKTPSSGSSPLWDNEKLVSMLC